MNWVEFSRIITVIASFAITAGLYRQGFMIWKTRSAGDFSMLLVIALVFNELAWLNYGITIIEWPIMLVALLNIPAVAMATIGYFKFNKGLTRTVIPKEKPLFEARVSDIGTNNFNSKLSIRFMTTSEYERAGGHDFFAKMSARFFARHPWKEKYICPACKNINDFTDYMNFTDKNKPCPQCGTVLKPFWSVERFRRYVNDFNVRDFKGYIAWEGSSPVGWITGFSPRGEELPKNKDLHNNSQVFCIDLLGTVPGVRRKGGVMSRAREVLFAMRLRRFPFNAPFIDLLIKWVGLPVVGILYFNLLRDVHNDGYKIILTKTHRKAHSVLQLLKLGGFRDIGVDESDQRFSYWVKNLG